MPSRLMLLPLLLASASARLIDSVAKLNSAIKNGPNHAVGYVSAAGAVTPSEAGIVLPDVVDNGGPLEVKTYSTQMELEQAVRDSEVVAGYLKERPPVDPDEEFTSFPSSFITVKAPLFAKEAPGNLTHDSSQLKQAINAAIVRLINNGSFHELEERMYREHGYDFGVAAFSCGLDTSKFDFPDPSTATGLLRRVIDTHELRVSTYGPFDWGKGQGDYTANPPTGFWPEYMELIMRYFNQAYPGVQMVREYSFDPLTYRAGPAMTAVIAGEQDMTEAFMTVSQYHDGSARGEVLDVGCTTLGTEGYFFTLAPPSKTTKELPTWAVGVIVGFSVLLLSGCCFVAYMIRFERKGKPIFLKIGNNVQRA